MTDDGFEKMIRESAANYNAPGDVPREEIWQRIAAVRAERRSRSRTRVAPWLVRTAGIAAVLALGIAIGRIGFDRLDTTGTGLSVAPPDSAPSQALRIAVLRHLARTETFLTLVRTEASGGYMDQQVSGNARKLLSTTRMMLDSPALDDPTLSRLLSDIELVLAQIAQLSDQRKSEDLNYINEGIEERNMLPRLRGIESGSRTGPALVGGAP